MSEELLLSVNSSLVSFSVAKNKSVSIQKRTRKPVKRETFRPEVEVSVLGEGSGLPDCERAQNAVEALAEDCHPVNGGLVMMAPIQTDNSCLADIVLDILR